MPEGFVAARTGKGAPAEWKVRDDPTANGGRVLEQTSSDRTDYRFPLAIYQGVSAANLEVTVRFKAGAGQVDRAGGIAVRLSDPDNYYVVRANALEGNVNLYRVVKGVRSQIQGFRTKVSSERVAYARHASRRRPARGIVRRQAPVHGAATGPSPVPARSRSGPRPTASPVSSARR